MDHPQGPDAFGTSPKKGRVENDEYAALAGLFLDDSPLPHPALAERKEKAAETPRFTAEPVIPESPRVEMLVVGHLPVLASAWIAEYARSVASTEQTTVGMYRENTAQVSVDVVGLRNRSEQGEFRSAAGAIASLGGKIGVWLVKPVTEIQPGMLLPEDSCLTVLTGADEAAVVATYRTLKRLFISDKPMPERVKVVVMGSEEDAGSRAAERLQRATESFLNHKLEVVVSSNQVTPGRSAHIYRGDCIGDLHDNISLMTASADKTEHQPEAESEAVIRDLLDEQPQPAEPEASPPVSFVGADFARKIDQTIVPEPARTEPKPRMAVNSMPDPLPVRVPLPKRPEAGTKLHRDPRTSTHVSVEVLEVPADSRFRIQPAQAEPEIETVDTDALASHLPGLTPVAVTCPFNTDVQIAYDGRGRIHLLVNADELEDLTRDGFQVALESLSVVRPWATSHAALLSLATRGKITPGKEPVLHLLTSRPIAAKRLLDGDVRIHLLTRSPKHPDVWVCVDLN